MSGSHAPVSLIALRDRREEAIQRLSDCFVADLIGVDAFEDRLSRVHAATTIAAVDLVLADLPPLPAGAPRTALAPLTVNPALPRPGPRLRSLLGNIERRGAWTVPASLRISATLGNVELDFRDARFTAGVTEIDARVVLGNVELTVPPNLAVECDVSTILGNSESHGTGGVADPDRPLLRVRGYAFLGNVEIHTRLPGETDKDREARERKRRALEKKEARRLGPVGQR